MAGAYGIPDIDSMSDEEFDAWFQGLDPASQQQVIYQMNYGATNAATPAFGGSSPYISPASYDVSTMFTPNADVDAKGNVEPWDLSNQAQGWNYVQDQMQSLLSPSSMITGGAGSYDPALFQPTLKYSGPTVDTTRPGAEMVGRLADTQGNGWSAILARDIADGVDPSVAVGNLMKLVENAIDNPDVNDPLSKSVLESLPRNYEGLTPEQQASLTPEQKALAAYDLDSLMPYAQDLAMKVAEDPTSFQGFEDPTTGLMYANAPVEEWSKAAQAFRDAGLPMPTESYSDPERLNAIAPVDREGFARRKEAQARGTEARQTQADAALANADALAKEYEKYQTEMAQYRVQKADRPSATPTAIPTVAETGDTLGHGAYDDIRRAKGLTPTGVPAQPTLSRAELMDPNRAQNPTPTMTRDEQLRSAGGGSQGRALDFGGAIIDLMGQKAAAGPTAPTAPTAYMKNGQWTFGEMDPETVKQYSQHATNWSPEMGSPVTQAMVDTNKRKAAQAQYLADRAKNRINPYQASGTKERIAADFQAMAMERQGRTPLTDAYMQRMMGMRGFGMR